MDGNAAEDFNSVVLLVEDNPDHAELISRCLDEDLAGSLLFRVRDGEEALEYLEHKGVYAEAGSSPRPGLILMDLRLPRLDGISLLRIIKNDVRLSSIPVVVLTTSTAAPDLEGAYRAQANAYMAKPLNFDEFRSQLRCAARFWLKYNHVPPDSASA